jgi:hypothetical protein
MVRVDVSSRPLRLAQAINTLLSAHHQYHIHTTKIYGQKFALPDSHKQL